MLIPILFVGLCIAVLYFYGTKRMVNLISGIQGSIRGTLGGTADMAYVFLEARWPLISPYHKHFMLFLTSAIMFGSSGILSIDK